MRMLAKTRRRYRDLSRNDLLKELLKVFALIVSITCGIVALLAPLALNHVYIARINCSRFDIQSGIYLYIQGRVFNQIRQGLSNHSAALIDNAFTKSSILLLSNYAKQELQKAPQNIVHNLWNWCAIGHDIKVPGSKPGLSDKNSTCLPYAWPVAFDYPSELNAVGLTFLLQFTSAVNGTESDPRPWGPRINSRVILIAPTLILSIALQICVLLGCFFLEPGVTPESDRSLKLKTHFVSYLSLLSFLAVLTSLLSTTYACNMARKDLNANLKAFGFNLVIGLIWFSLLNGSAVAAFCSAVLHLIPVCCADAADEPINEDFAGSHWALPRQYMDDKDSYELGDATTIPQSTGHGNKFRGLFHAQRAALHRSYKDHEAEELARLGEALYAKPIRTGSTKILPEPRIQETQNLLYQDSGKYSVYPNHTPWIHEESNRSDICLEMDGADTPNSVKSSNYKDLTGSDRSS